MSVEWLLNNWMALAGVSGVSLFSGILVGTYLFERTKNQLISESHRVVDLTREGLRRQGLSAIPTDVLQDLVELVNDLPGAEASFDGIDVSVTPKDEYFTNKITAEALEQAKEKADSDKINDILGQIDAAFEELKSGVEGINKQAALAPPAPVEDRVTAFSDWAYGWTALGAPAGKEVTLKEVYDLDKAPAWGKKSEENTLSADEFLSKAKADLKKKKLINPDGSRVIYNPLAQDDDFFMSSDELVTSRKRYNMLDQCNNVYQETKVDKLDGPTYDSLEDLDYFKKKLHENMRIPKCMVEPKKTYRPGSYTYDASTKNGKRLRSITFPCDSAPLSAWFKFRKFETVIRLVEERELCGLSKVLAHSSLLPPALTLNGKQLFAQASDRYSIKPGDLFFIVYYYTNPKGLESCSTNGKLYRCNRPASSSESGIIDARAFRDISVSPCYGQNELWQINDNSGDNSLLSAMAEDLANELDERILLELSEEGSDE